MSGRIEGLAGERAHGPEYRPLKFPSTFRPTTKDAYNPSTAIKTFSSGRHHVLALTDDGMLWSWWNKNEPSRFVEFTNVRTILNSRSPSTPGTVLKVVAGWEMNAALISGTGIVYWPRTAADSVNAKGLLLVTPQIISGTGFQKLNSTREQRESEDARLGEVQNFVVLENYIVFITDLNKVFAVRDGEEEAIELPTFSAPGRVIQDIQGAFRKFAVFSSDGDVLMGNTELIRLTSELATSKSSSPSDSNSGELPQPAMPPALQQNGVINISFGDYHFCALHANGKISSHGREPRGCGALGLGSLLGGIPFRSLTSRGEGHLQHLSDVTYYSFAENRLHHIWFEPEKRLWLFYLNDESRSMGIYPDWLRPLQDNRQGILEKYSPCVERAGDSWDDFPDIKAEDPDGLGAYFALNVASAGWQSAALVLVNENLARKIRAKHIDFEADVVNEDDDSEGGGGGSGRGGSKSHATRPPPRVPDGKSISLLLPPRFRHLPFPLPISNSRQSEHGARRPVKYQWEKYKFPALPADKDGAIDFSMYNFDEWVYGLPPLESDDATAAAAAAGGNGNGNGEAAPVVSNSGPSDEGPSK